MQVDFKAMFQIPARPPPSVDCSAELEPFPFINPDFLLNPDGSQPSPSSVPRQAGRGVCVASVVYPIRLFDRWCSVEDLEGVDSHGIKQAESNLQPVQPVSEAGEYLGSCPCRSGSSHVAHRLHISFHATPNSGVSSGGWDESLTFALTLHNHLLSDCQSNSHPTLVFVEIFTEHALAEPSTLATSFSVA